MEGVIVTQYHSPNESEEVIVCAFFRALSRNKHRQLPLFNQIRYLYPLFQRSVKAGFDRLSRRVRFNRRGEAQPPGLAQPEG
jgi:hypothetical protein